MERKLSQKAAQMRQRLFNRHRAATMTSTAPSTNTSNRSRSATTPISSTQPDFTWDNTATRYYHFTDEPGYFRPASPFIHRQEVEEDLEDNVKHACGLLVESIERGLPIWPSFHAQSTQQHTAASLQNPMTQLSLSPVALDTLIPTTDRDTPILSSPPTRPTQNSYSLSAATGRFYGRRLSTPPPESPEFERGRPRGISSATDSTSPRSRSSSPGFFPYSPPQTDTAWGRDTTQIFESPDETLFPSGDAFLGAEGLTWLRASLDMNCEREDRAVTAPGPAPRRFYSVRQADKEERFRWDAFDVAGSRESVFGGLNVERKSAQQVSYAVGESDGEADGDVSAARTFYSGLPDGEPVRQRRKRASDLLRKLTGLGMRRKETVEAV